MRACSGKKTGKTPPCVAHNAYVYRDLRARPRDYGSRGREFESLRARHPILSQARTNTGVAGILACGSRRTVGSLCPALPAVSRRHGPEPSRPPRARHPNPAGAGHGNGAPASPTARFRALNAKRPVGGPLRSVICQRASTVVAMAVSPGLDRRMPLRNSTRPRNRASSHPRTATRDVSS